MEEFNLNNKKFVLLANSENGRVNGETIFQYRQQEDIVTADYSGGTILYGKIIGLMKGDTIEMLYNCLTTEKELKAGKATAIISFNEQRKMKLSLDWQWLDQVTEKAGKSEYIEIE
jgi:hypothetical protein